MNIIKHIHPNTGIFEKTLFNDNDTKKVHRIAGATRVAISACV